MCLYVCVCVVVEQEELIRRLRGLQWSPLREAHHRYTRDETGFSFFAFGPDDCLYEGPPTPSEQLMAMYLSVLRAVQLHSDVKPDELRVVLTQWDLIEEQIEALSGLPHWSGELYFPDCGCPSDLTLCKRFADVIPTSYHTWVVSASRESPEGQAITEAVNERRLMLGLPELVIRYYE